MKIDEHIVVPIFLLCLGLFGLFRIFRYTSPEYLAQKALVLEYRQGNEGYATVVFKYQINDNNYKNECVWNPFIDIKEGNEIGILYNKNDPNDSIVNSFFHVYLLAVFGFVTGGFIVFLLPKI